MSAQHAAHAVPVIPQELLERPVVLHTGIGKAHDAVTTKAADAQAFYDQGLAYLHSYVWIEAARSFHQALRLDPKLALAHVGLSVAYVELNKPADARRAMEKARAMQASVSDHERRHIDVRALQMAAEETPADQSRLVAYRQGLDAAIALFPSDVELVLRRGIAESPDPADRGQGSTAGSIPYFERALKASPNNFAARHYLTHAFENTGRATDALTSANAYATLAPAIPHAVHMHGHELRHAGRVAEAIARFESADRLQTAYFSREKIAPEFDWHHQHNLDLLATSYQYVGQMQKAEALLKQSFGIPSNLLVQVVNKREWPVFLLARGRAAESLAAANELITYQHPVVQASGQIEAGFVFLATNRYADAAAASNAALKLLRGATEGQALVMIPLEALQGEFLLRTGQRDKGRTVMERAAQKLRALPGPDAWSQSLFRLEAMARAAREAGDWLLAGRMAALMNGHDPSYAGTHYSLALVALHEGNSATARREFSLAEAAWVRADSDALAVIRKR